MNTEIFDITEEQQFWLYFGYQPEGVIFCTDCQKIHATNCLRND